RLKKITLISSSMIYESAKSFPSSESNSASIRPPRSAYGLQKLASEYFAHAAWDQFGLPYTIVRAFNCIGIGEQKPKLTHRAKGNTQLAMNHAVSDLILKVLQGQNPLHIFGSGKQIRHFTYGGDLAKAIVTCIFSAKAKNEVFNISSPRSISVIELARLIWQKIRPGLPFRYIRKKAFIHDVQKRVPDVTKAKRILGVSCDTPLEEVLDEMIPWMKKN
ncbi:NAD(P)-dependent oxidoreductase, partial [Candidatus Roizmanbacteria bacterium]|nr:NAD(P)-dependent oxidoreductase [Candidatus Roizmanbacteria bacterium]